MQICFHVFKNQIQVLIVFGLENLMHFDYIGVIELMEENYLSVGSLSISGMLKGVKDLFQSHGLAGRFVSNFPDMAVRAATNLFDECIFFKDVGLDFLCHFLSNSFNFRIRN